MMMSRSRLFGAIAAGAGALLAASWPLVAADASSSTRAAVAEELEALALDTPGDAVVARKLATVLLQMGDVRHAEQWMDYADALDPEGAAVQAALEGQAAPTPRGAIGPDIIVGVLTDTKRYSLADPRPYTFGAASCNIGDADANWFANTVDHPIIAQQAYRLKDGRFEQIGLSWAKHAFVIIPEELCGGPCQDPDGGDLLGPGCSDTYSAATNGSISRLGPRTQINPADGTFPIPWPEPTGSIHAGYVFIDQDDLDPALNPEARYFAEVQYIAADDAAAGNDLNNVSYREFLVDTPGGFPSFDLLYSSESTTQSTDPAIMAWADLDSEVQTATIDIPNDGRLILAWKVAQTDDAQRPWSYEYALYNMNSHRAARSFRLPAPAGADLVDLGFHDVDYHSGDGLGGVNVDGADWAPVAIGGELAWTTEDEATNPNGNALRWGTLYNFRFTSDQPPTSVTATIDLFRAGSPASVSVQTVAPAEPPCLGDFNGDGAIGPADLAALLGNWGTNDIPSDLNQSGEVNAQDLAMLLGSWGGCG